MPHPFAPVKVDSLVAVYLTVDRCNELDLDGFAEFEPLIAKVVKVLDNGFECHFLESQSAQGNSQRNGLVDGYNGRWHTWQPFEDQDPPVVALTAHDIYASNFKLTSRSRLCLSLQDELKRSLAIFRSAANELADEARGIAGRLVMRVPSRDFLSDLSTEIV